MKKNKIMGLTLTAVLALTFGVVGAASAAIDMTPVTDAITAGEVVTAIGVVAGIKFLPRAAKWAYNQVIGFVR